MSTAYSVQQTSAPAAQTTPASFCQTGRAASAAAAPWAPCPPPANRSRLMQAMPAATTSSGSSSRDSGTAPWSRRPITVTEIGRMPMISEVGPTPASCTPKASST